MKKEKRADLKEREQKILDCLNTIPDNILREEPRFAISGEIIPEIFRSNRDEINYQLEIRNRNKHIELTPFIPKHIDRIEADGTRHVVPFRSDGNQVEIFCHQSEGLGYYQSKYRGHFISTADIKAMADCIRSVTGKEKTSAAYTCQDDFISLEISYDPISSKYSIMIAVLDISNGDHCISVTRKGLTRKALDLYIDPIFKWEDMFPMINSKH